MAIRNANLGGTDWDTLELGVSSEDLNDTFNVMANFAKTLTCFWLNSNLRELYDDFSSYTTDDVVPTTLWATTLTDSTLTYSYFKTRASTLAGGSSKEGELYSYALNTGSKTHSCIASSKSLTANAHKFTKVYVDLSYDGSQTPTAGAYVSFNKGTNYDAIGTFGDYNATDSITFLTTIMVIAKGGDEYDCYIGGKLVRTVTDASFEFRFKSESSVTGSNSGYALSKMFITDIYESKGTV